MAENYNKLNRHGSNAPSSAIKHDESAAIQADVDAYLKAGGVITVLPPCMCSGDAPKAGGAFLGMGFNATKEASARGGKR